MCQVVKKSRSYVTFFKMIINIVVIIIINNRLFNTHTHVCEFITSKPHGTQKQWHATSSSHGRLSCY